MRYSVKNIARILGVNDEHLTDSKIENLLTDSRSLIYPETTLFFALHTHNGNGVNYIPSLYAAGVRNFVVEAGSVVKSGYENANFIEVESPLKALQMLAKHHRSNHHIPVVGITGSKGKTIVKEWLYQLLREDFRIARSPRSYNSQIGVPLSLWEIEDNTTLAIIEAGVSLVGEMEQLAQMILPTVGVITNIEEDHDDGFETRSQKCREKCRLAADCRQVIYCADDAMIAENVEAVVKENCRFAWTRSGAENAALKIFEVKPNGNSTEIIYEYKGEKNAFTIPFKGDVNVENAIHSLAVMLCMQVARAEIALRMAKLEAVATRMDVIEGCNNCLLICDSYSADYNSLAPALDFMSRRATSDRVSSVILSDVMHESFEEKEIYEKIARLLKSKKISRIIAVGGEFMQNREFFGDNAEFYNTTEEFLQNCSVSDFRGEQILIKGKPEFGFSRIIEMLEARTHETVLEVNLDALASNFNFYRSFLRPETKVVCMLKASGYGAGSYELAKTLQDRGAGYIAVAVVDEGVDLRKAGITMPIMVLNPKVVNYRDMFENRLEPEIFSMDICREIIREAQKYNIKNFPVHIKLDTGMHRLGFLKEQLPELIELLKSQDAITPCSIFSHLAVADMPCDAMDEYTRSQLDYFDECVAMIQSKFDHHIMRHILNTAGTIRFTDHQYDMVRIGIGLYGVPILNNGTEDALQQVSSLSTIIISIKEWEPGITIGYGRKGVLKRKSRIATVPVGYADGLNRHLSNGNCKMYVNGTLCPVVGNICMDACMIDVTDADCKVGDRVEIFGKHIPVSVLSDTLGTIPYEVLTSVSTRVKRVYYRE